MNIFMSSCPPLPSRTKSSSSGRIRARASRTARLKACIIVSCSNRARTLPAACAGDI